MKPSEAIKKKVEEKTGTTIWHFEYTQTMLESIVEYLDEQHEKRGDS